MTRIASFRNARKHARRVSSARLRLEWLERRDVPSPVTHQFSSFADQLAAARTTAAATPQTAGVNVNTDTVDTLSNETSIAVNPTAPNNLIGSANDYQLSIAANGAVNETVLSKAHASFDGGNTWSVFNIPSLNYTATGDPGVAFDASGTAYASFLGDFVSNNTYPDVWTTRSGSSGRNWSKNPVVVAHNVTNPDGSGIFNDKPYIAAWGDGNAIITYTQFNLGPNGSYIKSPIFASITHDGGQTWSTPTQISDGFIFDQFSTPTVAADGSIYVSFVSSDLSTGPDFRDNYMVVKVDPNSGAAVATPVVVGQIFDGVHDYPINVDGRETLQDSEFRVNPSGDLTADPTNALHLAVIWSDMRNSSMTNNLDPYVRKTNSDVIVSQSFDGGLSWSAPTALAVPNDQFYPWGKYDASGLLQIGYMDRSYDPDNHQYGFTLASETAPGSLTFSTREVSTALSDPTQNDRWFATTQNKFFPHATTFLGDYNNIAITSTGVAAFWTDMRLPATFLGVTRQGENAFFADPSTPASASAILANAAPSVASQSLSAPATLSSSHSGDGLSALLADMVAENFARAGQSALPSSVLALHSLIPDGYTSLDNALNDLLGADRS